MANNEIQPLAQEIKEPSPVQQPPKPPILPTQVTANIELDKKKYEAHKQEVKSIEQAELDSKSKPKDPDKTNRIIKKTLKISAIFFGIIVFCFVSLFILTITNIDVAVFKITLTGTITDRITKEPVPNAQVMVNDSPVGTSDQNGKYSVGNLNLGLANVKITADGYQDINEEVSINRLFLNYTTKRDFELTPKEKAVLAGKFIASQDGYDFLQDRIIVNDKEYNINTDGTFRLSDVEVGLATFEFISPNFKDISNEIEVEPGINQLQDITLDPAGDIEGELVTYVREDIVNDITFNVENVSEEQKEIEDDIFRIKDLDIGREYKIQVVSEGYKTRDYSITIKQGINQLFEFKLVENGFGVFLTEDPVSRSDQFYRSDFDGFNLEQITNFNRINVENEYFNSSNNSLYYISDKERLKSGTSLISVIYSIDVNIKTETRVTQNLTTLGTLHPNYQANKMLSILEQRTDGVTEYKLTVMDLAGNNRSEIKTTRNQVGKIAISDDGNYLFFEERTSGSPTLLRVDINSKQERTITQGSDISLYDVSSDGNTAIYSKKNTSTNFTDLFAYNFNSNETRIIKENLDGQKYQFIEGDNNTLFYFANRDGRYNLFKYTIDQNKDERVTNLSAGDEILNIYQQENFAFYITENGLYVIDILKPHNYKIIVEGEISYTGN